MSDFEFKPGHKFFQVTISSIKYIKKYKFRYYLSRGLQQLPL